MQSIKDLSRIFGSKTKAQEIVLLLNDAKDVVRQGFYEHELSSILEFCKENGIYLIKSEFRIILEDLNNGYSNKARKVSADNKQGMIFVYMSKSELKAKLAKDYEEKNNDLEFGLILEYPTCCIEYFMENFNEHHPNPEKESYNPWIDIKKRYNDIVLISHFPCSKGCKKSISLAKKYYEVILKNDPKRALELKEGLGLE